MNIAPKLRNAALVGALAAVTATAWATNESMSDATYVPAQQAALEQPAAPATSAVPVNESLAPNETVVAPADARADRDIARDRITIERRRLTEDERLQSVVMDALQHNGHLTGKIGVESHQAVVTLTGWTNTVGQAERAGRYARGVSGVRTVQNLIRPRVGGMVSS